jgi:1-acyl-sn-glycerol-3-phosphate acyltransferase
LELAPFDLRLSIMQKPSLVKTEENTKLTFPVIESNKSRFIGKLRYWWCWLAAGVMLIVIALPSMIFLQIIRRRLWLYPLCLWGARAWLKACGVRVKVKGAENLEEGKGYVFISNHRSYLDTATLFGFTGRRIGLVAKNELLKVPILGPGMSFVNIIAIDRTNAESARLSMQKAKDVIDNGYSFGVFAEGTRAMPGELLPFKKGAFHLAMQTQAPVVPVAIKVSDSLMGKRTGVAYSGTIEIVFLEPVETKGLSVENDLMDLLVQTRNAIASELGSDL